MLKYYTWALAEKILSVVPFGSKLYYQLGSLVNKHAKGRNLSFLSSLHLIKKAKELVPQNGLVLDVGSGWFHHDAFLLWLAGDYKIVLFDIRENSRLAYIKNYIQTLLNNLDHLSEELGFNKSKTKSGLLQILEMKTKQEVYVFCNFTPCISTAALESSFKESSFDFMISNCVLNHIPPETLTAELKLLRKLLKPDGFMYYLIGHDDHWSFHDTSANVFNYYRYSDRYYKIFFENKFEFQNRFVKSEWDEIFKKCGLKIADYSPYITAESTLAIKNLNLDKRFSKYSREELSAIWSFYLLKK
jgi:SAM-dependent methyltransferase